MASPITWQNVQGRSLAEAAIPMQAASQSILGGFDRLGKVFDAYQDMEKKKLDLADEANVQGFLDRLDRAKTPEDVAKLQASGELERYTSAINNPANLAKLRGAGDARTTALMQQIGAQQKFGADQQDRADAPIRDQVAVLNALGKADEAAALLAANPELRNRAPLAQGISAAQQTGITRDRETTRFNQTQATYDVNMANSQLQLTENQRKAEESDLTRNLDAAMGRAGAEHQARVAAARTGIGAAAKELGMPVDEKGNVGALDATQKKLLEGFLKSKGLPSLSILSNSDTDAGGAFINDMVASGKYTPAQITAAKARLTDTFSTTAMGAIGNDAATSAKKDAMTEALDAENRMRYGVLTTPENIKELRDVAKPMLSQLASPTSWRGESYRKQFAEFIDKGGIPTGDVDASGKQIRVLPSPEQLANLIDKVNTSHGVLGLTGFYGSDVKTVLEEWAASSEAKAGAKELIASGANKRARNVLKAELKPAGK